MQRLKLATIWDNSWISTPKHVNALATILENVCYRYKQSFNIYGTCGEDDKLSTDLKSLVKSKQMNMVFKIVLILRCSRNVDQAT